MEWNELKSHLRYLPVEENDRIEKAFNMGKKAHSNQKRKSGEPYFTHPIAVAHILANMGADADTVIAALLHDTVEDTEVTLDVIRKEIGEIPAALIDGLTKFRAGDFGEKPTMDEKIETLRKMFTVMDEDIRIMVIKLADRLHNMQTIQFFTKEKQESYAKETLDIYVKIADRLSMMDIRDELEALCLSVLEPENFPVVSRLRAQNERKATDMSKKVETEIATLDPKLTVTIFTENKPWKKLKILQDLGGGTVGTADVTLAFVCPTIEDCYKTFGVLHRLWRREHLSFQDFINAPMANGYRGLHTTMILSDGFRIRCKIRTEEMQRYAHFGIASKCFDSEAKGFGSYVSWTEVIAPLSKDSKEKSATFWTGLQRDILEESIKIHGPADEVVMVPQNASALDAAFYLFGTKTLKAKSVLVNGQQAPFGSFPKEGSSIDIHTGKHRTAELDWLKWTSTGLARAHIRTALSEESSAVKQRAGRTLLQDRMTKEHRGYLEEYLEEDLNTHLAMLGYSSLNETFEALAAGYVDPTTVIHTLFDEKKHRSEKKKWYTIRYDFAVDDLDAALDFFRLLKKYKRLCTNVRIRHRTLHETDTATFDLLLTNKEEEHILEDIRSSGITGIQLTVRSARWYCWSGVLTLSFLWGFDPVMVKMLLDAGVHNATFSVIRSVVTVICALLLTAWSRRRESFSRLPAKHPELWVSGIAFAGVNFFTYLCLSNTSPTVYNTVLRASPLILAPVLFPEYRKQYGMLLILGLAGFAALFMQGPPGIGYGLLALGAYCLYTYSSTLFQRKAHVQARSIQFFLFSSIVSAICIAPLALLAPPAPSTTLLMLTAAECLVFIGFSYVIFYSLTRALGYAAVSPWLNLIVAFGIIGEAALIGTGSLTWGVLLSALLFVTGNLIMSNNARRADSAKTK